MQSSHHISGKLFDFLLLTYSKPLISTLYWSAIEGEWSKRRRLGGSTSTTTAPTWSDGFRLSCRRTEPFSRFSGSLHSRQCSYGSATLSKGYWLSGGLRRGRCRGWGRRCTIWLILEGLATAWRWIQKLLRGQSRRFRSWGRRAVVSSMCPLEIGSLRLLISLATWLCSLTKMLLYLGFRLVLLSGILSDITALPLMKIVIVLFCSAIWGISFQNFRWILY